LPKKRIPDDISKDIEEFSHVVEEAENQVKENLKDNPDLDFEKELNQRRHKELALVKQQWEENGKTGRPPQSISPLRCAIVLEEYFSFILFDLEENSRVAMYLSKEGIYTQNETLIRRYIAMLEPKHNSIKARDVIYHLTTRAVVKPKTNSRFLIPVDNGVFNLKTKELEPFSPDYVFTSKIATEYVDAPELPTIEGWNVEDWIKELASYEEDLVALLWQVISDSMNGNYTRKKSIWLYSEGNSGKGSYQTLIQNLVGHENVATLKLPQFSNKFTLPMLEGKTVCIGDDVPAGVYIDDSSNFNSIVTGERIMVEQKHRPVYSTQFTLTIIQSTNGLPRIHNKSEGTYRRLLIVEFKKQYTAENDNWRIKDEYIHRKDVLQYVLHKAINMDFERFTIPKSSQELMEKYKIENDPVRDFKVSVFDNFESTRIPIYIVYQYYIDFCEENHYKVMSSRNFYNAFELLLENDWSKKNSKLSDFFKEPYLPKQFEKNTKIEVPDSQKTYMCYVNRRLELVS